MSVMCSVRVFAHAACVRVRTSRATSRDPTPRRNPICAHYPPPSNASSIERARACDVTYLLDVTRGHHSLSESTNRALRVFVLPQNNLSLERALECE
mmetsp:Transcript_6420/g.21001  ORF Transcript_6420/g.21001 Transcript_6420/m.21001 type:complete len:97 (-) Transcript_6420:69-359(-)